jgi:hypothetical protein
MIQNQLKIEFRRLRATRWRNARLNAKFLFHQQTEMQILPPYQLARQHQLQMSSETVEKLGNSSLSESVSRQQRVEWLLFGEWFIVRWIPDVI